MPPRRTDSKEKKKYEMENEPELELIEHNPVFQAIVSVAVYEKAFKWHAYRPPSANYRSNPHVRSYIRFLYYFLSGGRKQAQG